MLGLTTAETGVGTWHSLCKPAARVFLLVLVLLGRKLSRVFEDRITPRESVENVVSVEDKPDAVTSNGHEGRYVSAAADFRSKENQHAYENTVEPEEKVITTAM
ncbi:PDZK1-interacting protein 1 isoform X2 [Cyanistes caeruleus]|uniref:PDZK1-interacting protein 1 isoform X2 n=1 Tax=Cyanistes caeruleus TaxID=156563 RepID=UPI000CDA9321|nr:PDZK1-interacting protein 1 isoform X2 [Cyanistes caeruleus]